MDLNPTADWRTWEATKIVRVGEAGLHLLVPTNRKRHLPIVIEVDSDLLTQLLALRGKDVPTAWVATNRELVIKLQASEELIKQSNRVIRTLQMDLTAKGDHLEDAERRLKELRDAYHERGEQVNRLKTILEQENEAARSLKLRCEAMAAAIRKVLNPRDPFAAWKTVHTAFRNALIVRSYHERAEHPRWSRHRWFGCSCCVPDWMLLDASSLDELEASIPRYVADALDRETAAILAPALISKKDS